MNRLCHEYLNTDILRMLTLGMMSNYGFMLNLPSECLYKSDHGHKNEGTVKTRLYLCDKKENEMISESVDGGRAMPRMHHFLSNDLGKKIQRN